MIEKSIDKLQMIGKGEEILKNAAIQDWKFDVKYLIEEIYGKKFSNFLFSQEDEIDKKFLRKFFSAIEKRTKNIPLAYIFGRKFFYRNYFFVSKSTLIPRQDSEILVEKALEFANELSKSKKVKILDICSGTGCLGLSLGKEIINSDLTFLDISKNAMKICEKNAKFLELEDRSRFVIGNILKDDILDKFNEKFDIILYNPPYIRKNEILKLDLEVQMEPKKALDGGRDGLKFYKRLRFIIENFLEKNGKIFIEIAHNQANDVQKILGKNCEVFKDLNEKDRIVIRNFY